jgi:xanthine dehydrogenase molybdopterin-binding subunit B
VEYIGTNNKVNTELYSTYSFRGFGGPQGMLITEAMIHQIADHLNIPVIDIQVSKNLP